MNSEVFNPIDMVVRCQECGEEREVAVVNKDADTVKTFCFHCGKDTRMHIMEEAKKTQVTVTPEAIDKEQSALSLQVAGSHYKSKAIQPVEYIHANNLSFLEGCIVKRITRWRDKDGFQDLLKIKHEVDLLIELETRKQKAEDNAKSS